MPSDPFYKEPQKLIWRCCEVFLRLLHPLALKKSSTQDFGTGPVRRNVKLRSWREVCG